MKKQNVVASIDVGTTKICTILADVSDGGPRILGVGITPSKGLHKGLVVNINEARETIRDSVRKAEQAGNFKVESAYVGVTGRHVTSINNHGVVAITRNDRVVRPDDLKRVLATAQSVKTANDRRLLHVIPRAYAVDGQSGVKNPVGMHGFRLDVETHVITAAVTSIQNLVKCIRSIGIDIEDLVLEPLASSEAVLTQEEKQQGVILADIGGGTTDIAVFTEGAIRHTAVIPIAGDQVTNDIAVALRTPTQHAEDIKIKYGCALAQLASADETIEVPSVGDRAARRLARQTLADVVEPRYEELFTLVQAELRRSGFEDLCAAGVVLTGGSAKMEGVVDLAEEIFHMPVRLGMPQGVSGLVDVVRNPIYSTGVGLLLFGLHNRSGGVASELRGSGGLSNVVQRMKSWFQGNF